MKEKVNLMADKVGEEWEVVGGSRKELEDMEGDEELVGEARLGRVRWSRVSDEDRKAVIRATGRLTAVDFL